MRVQNFEIQFLKEATKFVQDFHSLAKEVDESLAKHKALELEIERLLRVVIKRLQAQLGDQKGKSKDTPRLSDTLDPLSQKLENENVELEFQVYEQKDTNKGTGVNTQFLKQSILGKPPSSSEPKLYSVTSFPKSTVIPKVGKSNALSKPVISNSAPSSRESTVVNNERVIAPGIFRINPFKASKIGSKERLALPKPSTPRSCLRWSPTGRIFDLKGKIITTSESVCQSDCSKGDNACTSNPQDSIFKRFPSSTFSMTDASVLAIWECIRPRSNEVECNEVEWFRVVWFSLQIPRHAIHLWLVIQRKLKNQDMLRQWDVSNSNLHMLCLLCDSTPNSHEHLFFECTFSSRVWDKLKEFTSTPNIPSDLNVIVDFIYPFAKMSSFRSAACKLVFAASSYFIWQERNFRLFKKIKRNPDQIVEMIKSSVRLKLLTCI
ncbi:retrovirus-related pol polyprotein from transposon TNT 1-94 [Tanacetum coccineum]